MVGLVQCILEISLTISPPSLMINGGIRLWCIESICRALRMINIKFSYVNGKS